MADHSAIPVLESHLPPTDVATEEDDIPAISDERLNVIPHFARPVLVMSHTDKEVIVVRKTSTLMQINACTIFDGETIPFKPSDKSLLAECTEVIREDAGPIKGHRRGLGICVETATTPVIVRLRGVDRDGNESLRVCPWPTRLDNEKHLARIA
jgi:hypothetical protein